MNEVFVYGTLQKEFGNHRVMGSAGGQFLGKASTVDNYPLVVDGLPYLIDKKGEGSRVEGEVYRANNFSPLDCLEGHPTFYERRVRDVELEDGRVIPVWMYFLNGNDWVSLDDKIYWSSYTEALGDREKRLSAY